MMDDRGMSELLGYTVLVAIVSVASVALLAGSLGTLAASEKGIEFQGSVAALRSFASVAAGSARSNNTYDTAFEMVVPAGGDLVVRGMRDDFRSLSIYADSAPLAYLPLGSVEARSPFRSVAYEGGAVVSNDTGIVAAEVRPQVYAASLASGRKALFLSATSIAGTSRVEHAGAVTLLIRCDATEPLAWHIPDGGSAVIRIRSGEPAVWGEALSRCGFTVTYEDGGVRAVSHDVSDIYCTRAEVEVHG